MAVFGSLQRELGDLRRQVNRLASFMARNGSSGSFSGPLSSEIQSLSEELLAADLDAGLLHEALLQLREDPDIAKCVAAPNPISRLRSVLRQELGSMFSINSAIGAKSGGPRVVALTGPPGAGKTSSLVKLAARHSVRTNKPAQILSADMYRIGAAEQLRSFAAILGVGFQAIGTTGALSQALDEHRYKDLVLIDTPGHGERDIEASAELAAFFQSNAEIDVHLTLPASMKMADMRSATSRYERFRPAKLLLTKLDETTSLGTVLSESIRSGLPISFLSTGQQIPEDLEAATKERILDGVFAGIEGEAATSAFAGTVSLPDPCWEGPVTGRAAAA